MLALLLAVALGLSNLAAAIGFGAGGVSGRTRMRIAVVFGLFEAGMPALGLGARIGAAAGERSEMIACGLLVVAGAVIAAGVL